MSNSNLPDTLIVVCAHAVYVGPSSSSILKPKRDSSDVVSGGAGAGAGAGEVLVSLPGDDEAKQWCLESFQIGEAATFVRHVEEGVRLHAECLEDGSRMGDGEKNGRGNGIGREDESGIRNARENGTGRGRSLLVFSGGAVKTGLVHRGVRMGVGESVGMRAGDGKDERRTNREKAEEEMEWRTEARGYKALAKARSYFGFNADGLEDTMLVEEYSTDSFQNVLFGLIVYYKHISKSLTTMHLNGSDGIEEQAGQRIDAGRDPLKKLIIVSHAFKKPRFMHLHLKTLRFPTERVQFVGIDPPWTGGKGEDMISGERQRGHKAWEEDGRGVGAFLSGKRRERGWDADVFVREVLREGREGAEGWRFVFEKLVMGEHVEERDLPWEEGSG